MTLVKPLKTFVLTEVKSLMAAFLCTLTLTLTLPHQIMVCLGLLVMMTVSVFHHVHNLVKLLLMAAVCLVTALALAPASCGHLASLPLAVSLLHLLNRAADYKAR